MRRPVRLTTGGHYAAVIVVESSICCAQQRTVDFDSLAAARVALEAPDVKRALGEATQTILVTLLDTALPKPPSAIGASAPCRQATQSHFAVVDHQYQHALQEDCRDWHLSHRIMF